MIEKCSFQQRIHKVVGFFLAAKNFLVKKVSCRWRGHVRDSAELSKLILQ